MRLSVTHLRLICLFAGLAFGVVLAEVFVVHSAAFTRRPDWVSLAVTLDLAVGLPTLYYFLLVRRLKLPIRSLLAIFSAALVITALILPPAHQQLTSLLRRALTLVEVGSVAYILFRGRSIIRHYRQLRQTNADFIQNLSQSMDLALGTSQFNRILVSELALFRYGLFAWTAPVEKSTDDIAFTSHRQSGQLALTMVLIGVGLIGTFVVHLLLDRWHPLAAWLLTGLGLYGLLFFVADVVATIKRPVLVRPHELVVRFGLRGYGTVNRKDIIVLKAINDKPTRAVMTLNGAFLTTPNVLISLQKPVTMTGPLGRRKTATQIALFIDDKNDFIHQLTA